MEPLMDLLKKDVKWVWVETSQTTFDKLELTVALEPMLRLPHFEKPFEVKPNASDKVIGGVLA